MLRPGPALVAAGADLVAGHSAHEFHGVQRHPDGAVLYDLGDFVDDCAVHSQLRNDLGLLWLVDVDADGRLNAPRAVWEYAGGGPRRLSQRGDVMAEPGSAAADTVTQEPGEGPVLACDGLRKSFGDLTAVDGISFAIAHGEAYGLLGPNGAGKTTVISMLCGLLVPDAGAVTVAGYSVTADARRAKAAIGYVPQEVALFPDLTARENLAFFGRLYGLRGAGLRDRVESTLKVVGLTDRGGDRVGTYSGGMKRRVNIAGGLLHEPQLVVLDEPTVGVDPQSRNAILESVAALSAAGTAILYTSHYMEEVERLCDRVGVVDSGRMVAEGTRRELVSRLGQRDRVEMVIDGDAASVARACEHHAGVDEAITGDQAVTLLVTNGRALLADIMAAATAAGSTVTSVEVVEPDLEAVFLHLTGKALRD